MEANSDALAAQLGAQGLHITAIAPAHYASAIAKNVVERFEVPADASPVLAERFEEARDLSRSEYPPPDDVAEACFAALFDDSPRERYLVVPVEEEADRMLAWAAWEWLRLNASTPFVWSPDRLVAHVEGLEAD